MMRRRALLAASMNDNNEGSNEGPIDIDNYLTIEALENDLMVKVAGYAGNYEYCIDGDGCWKRKTTNTSIQLTNAGQRISFRANTTTRLITAIRCLGGRYNLIGNCMSIIFGDNAADNHSLIGYDNVFDELFFHEQNLVSISSSFLPATTLADHCYDGMFMYCTSLTTAPELPATTLAENCYNMMFCGCTSLKSAPELPATTLADGCYYNMFSGCTSLKSAPELPATTLADGCYSYMFEGCTSLTTAPELPATTLTIRCYLNMFEGCTSLTTAPELPATTLTSGCYGEMFSGCTSLTTASELSATTLANYCYDRMFFNCSKLNYIKMLATDISATDCLYKWVNGIASTGTFVKNPNMTSLPTGTSGIPSGWTVVNDGEESSNNTITFPIKLYEGNNNPKAGEIIDYFYNSFKHLPENILNFEDHPDIFPDISQVLHLNDTWYVSTIVFDGDYILSLDAERETYNIDTGAAYRDILTWELSRDGNLYIQYD